MTWRDVLKIHPAAALFPLMSPEELRVLGKDIGANGLTSPIVLWRDQSGIVFLLDGRNRLDAIEMEGSTFTLGEHDEIQCDGLDDLPQREISVDDEINPYGYVISANIVRRHLTREQKGELIAALLRERPERSDRATAAIANVHHTTVGTKRAELEATGQISQLKNRTGLDGRARKAPAPPQTIHLKVTSTPLRIPMFTFTEESSGDALLSAEPAKSRSDALADLEYPSGDAGAAPKRISPHDDALSSAAPANPELVTPTRPDLSAVSADARLHGRDTVTVSAESPLDQVKRLVRGLPADELEVFKQWFREFAGGGTMPTERRRRGRPKGSTIASGAKPPIRKTQETALAAGAMTRASERPLGESL